MAQKKSNKDKVAKEDKKKGKKAKQAKQGGKKNAAAAPPPPADPTPEPPETPEEGALLTHEDALAMAEALVEMVNEGATDPVAFFVSGDDPLGRELIRLQGGEQEDMQGLVPVVLDAPQVRRYAMLTIADEMIWRNSDQGEE